MTRFRLDPRISQRNAKRYSAQADLLQTVSDIRERYGLIDAEIIDALADTIRTLAQRHTGEGIELEGEPGTSEPYMKVEPAWPPGRKA